MKIPRVIRLLVWKTETDPHGSFWHGRALKSYATRPLTDTSGHVASLDITTDVVGTMHDYPDLSMLLAENLPDLIRRHAPDEIRVNIVRQEESYSELWASLCF